MLSENVPEIILVLNKVDLLDRESQMQLHKLVSGSSHICLASCLADNGLSDYLTIMKESIMNL